MCVCYKRERGGHPTPVAPFMEGTRARLRRFGVSEKALKNRSKGGSVRLPRGRREGGHPTPVEKSFRGISKGRSVRFEKGEGEGG